VAEVGGKQVTYNLFGVVRGGLGDPTPSSGRPLTAAGQVVVDSVLHARPGQRIVLGGRAFAVTGVVEHRTLIGGLPVLYTSLADAQAIALNGRPLASAVVTTGVVPVAPSGFEVRTPSQVVASAVTQLASGRKSIESTRWLMWIVAVFIVGAMLYVAALDRVRDFAVLKALGSSSAGLFASLVIEAVVVTILAAAVADGLGTLLAPNFPQPVDIPTSAYLTLPLIAVVVGVVASTAALRRATGAQPAAAFS
jgi:putative ABC transport system permease protein